MEWNFNHSYSKSNLYEALRIPRFCPSGSAKTAAPLPSIAHTKLEDHVQFDNICNQQKNTAEFPSALLPIVPCTDGQGRKGSSKGAAPSTDKLCTPLTCTVPSCPTKQNWLDALLQIAFTVQSGGERAVVQGAGHSIRSNIGPHTCNTIFRLLRC